MAFGGFNNQSSNAPMSEINMIPLIDVMLVLLVIFMITAPLLTHSVKIDLPKVSSQVNQTKSEKIDFAIDENGVFYWNGTVMDETSAFAKFKDEALKTPAPELHLRADKSTPYQLLAQVMAAAGKAGLSKIAFVSEPAR